jgi:transposase
MEPVYGKVVAGIDVHKRMLAVVLVQSDNPEQEVERRRFGTSRSELHHLAEWLAQRQVKEAVMESTAQYWKPVWLALEGQFQLHLAQALSNAAPGGRKSDYVDARRLARRLVAGDLRLSYVPEAEQRAWRCVARTRICQNWLPIESGLWARGWM